MFGKSTSKRFDNLTGAEIPGPGSYDVISTSTSGNLMGIGLKSGFDRFAKDENEFIDDSRTPLKSGGSRSSLSAIGDDMNISFIKRGKGESIELNLKDAALRRVNMELETKAKLLSASETRCSRLESQLEDFKQKLQGLSRAEKEEKNRRAKLNAEKQAHEREVQQWSTKLKASEANCLKIKEMEEQNAMLKEVKLQLEVRVSSIETEFLTSKNDISRFATELEEVAGDLYESYMTRIELEMKVGDLIERLSSAEDHGQSLETDLQHVKEENNLLQSETVMLRSQLEGLQNVHHEAQELNQSFSTNLRTCEQQLEQMNTEWDCERRMHQQQISMMQEEADMAKVQERELSHEITALRSRTDHLEGNLGQLQVEYQQLLKEKSSLAQHVASLQSKNVSILFEKEELTDKLEKEVREKEALTTLLEENQEGLRLVETKKGEREKTIKELNMEKEESDRELFILRAELEKALQKTEQVKKESEEKEKALSQELKSTVSQKAQIEAECLDLKSQIKALNSTEISLREQLKEGEVKLGKILEMHNEVTRQLQATEGERDSLRIEAQQRLRSLEAMEQALESAEGEVEMMKEELLDARAKLETLEDVVQMETQKRERAGAQLERLENELSNMTLLQEQLKEAIAACHVQIRKDEERIQVLESFEAQAAHLADERDLLQNKISALMEDRDLKDKEMKRLAQDALMVEEALAESEKALKAYQESLGAEQKRNRQITEEMLEKNEEAIEVTKLLQSQALADAALLKEQKMYITELKSKSAGLEETVNGPSGLREQLESVTARLKSSESEKKSRETELKALRTKQQEDELVIAKARQALKTLEENERELEGFRQENCALHETKEAAEEQVQNLKTQIASLRVKLVDLGYLEQELVSATVESEMAKRQKALADRELQKLAREAGKAAGHSNPKQKIKHLQHLKEEIIRLQQENSGLEVELSATKSLLKKLDHKGVVRRPISHAIAKKPVVAATRPPMTSHNHTATSAKPKEILTPRSRRVRTPLKELLRNAAELEQEFGIFSSSPKYVRKMVLEPDENLAPEGAPAQAR